MSAPARIAAAIALDGILDAVEAKRAYGWVYDPEAPASRCRVHVWLDEELLGTCVAERQRRDLADAGIGDGGCAFELRFDRALDEAERERVRADAYTAEGAGPLRLDRFSRPEAGGAPPTPAAAEQHEALRSMVVKVAQHQARSFKQLQSTVESMDVTLAALKRSADATVRLADGARSVPDEDVAGRMAALEAMHLRFDRALMRLDNGADPQPRRDGSRAARWLATVLGLGAAFAVGALVQALTNFVPL